MNFDLRKNNFPRISDWGWMGDKSRFGTHGWYKSLGARGEFFLELEKLHKSRLKN
jgi:hypothetical protein